MGKVNKYRNVKTIVDGITFDSKAEAKRYGELKLLLKAGEIYLLQRQQPYKLYGPERQLICVYKADFDYFDARNDEQITEDVKGVITPVFRLKAKLFKANTGRDIVIISKAKAKRTPSSKEVAA